jgi:hypothetical protein
VTRVVGFAAGDLDRWSGRDLGHHHESIDSSLLDCVTVAHGCLSATWVKPSTSLRSATNALCNDTHIASRMSANGNPVVS